MLKADGIACVPGSPGTEPRADLVSIFSPCRSLREKPAMKDELPAAIEAGDEQQCVRLLMGLDETARRALHPNVANALAETDSAFKSDYGPSRPQILQRYTAARLAMLGTATLGELKRIGSWRFPNDAARVILAERRPGWLAEWSEFELERKFWNWKAVRALVRDGLI